MLLYEETKILEKAVGEEAVAVFARLFERREALDRAELATKEDLGALELRLRLEMEKVRAEVEKVRVEARETEARLSAEMEKIRVEAETTKAELKGDISQLRVDTARDLREMEMRMTIKLGGMMAASIAMVAALVKLL